MEEIIQKIRERLEEVRRIQSDFYIKGKQYPYWEGVVGQCAKEEYFLVELLGLMENTRESSN